MSWRESSGSSRGQGWWRDLRRAVSWHRRLVAAGLAAIAVAASLHALSPEEPPTTAVLAAKHDLVPGTTLGSDDLTMVALPASVVPDGVLEPDAEVIGRTIAGPVRAGEPITDVRVVGPSMIAALGPDLVGTPVRVADGGSAALVRPGDRVDLLATPVTMDGAGGVTRTLAADVIVLTVPAASDDGLGDGALLVIATTRTQAAALAGAAVTDRLSLVLRGPSRS